MLYQKQSDKIPKKINQKISKFSYYVDTHFPEVFSLNLKTSNLQNKNKMPKDELLTKQGQRNIVYNYFRSQCQNTALINSNSILSSVKKLYLNQDVIKINDMSYSRQSLFKQSYLPVYGFFSQIIDFILIVSNQNKNIQQIEKNKNTNLLKQNAKNNQDQINHNFQHNKKSKTLIQPRQYELYVIHNCNSFNPANQQIKKISWEYFIQRYHFTEKNLNQQSQIKYQLVYSYKSNPSLLSFQNKLTHQFIKSHCKIVNNNLQNLQILQGYLLQKSSQVQAHKKLQQDVAFSDQHKRQNKIPPEYYKQYLNLKKQIYKFYLNINGIQSDEHINKYFYDNLICRYLIAKEYHFQQAKKFTIEYLKWQHQMKTKYPTLDSFKEIHQVGAYRYIGQDFMGRPVVLSKAALVDVTTMQDIDKYCDYYIYFLQIYLRTKMRGYVDQMIVIGDLGNLGTKNFKLAITKRNVADSLKYGPQRQYALITVNVSTFAYTAWTFIKPLLPKKTLHKIQIVGSNKKDIVDTLITRMDISVVPTYLGGQNQNFDQNNGQSNKQQQLLRSSKTQKEGSNIIDQYEAVSVIQQNKSATESSFVNLFQSVINIFKK